MIISHQRDIAKTFLHLFQALWYPKNNQSLLCLLIKNEHQKILQKQTHNLRKNYIFSSNKDSFLTSEENLHYEKYNRYKSPQNLHTDSLQHIRKQNFLSFALLSSVLRSSRKYYKIYDLYLKTHFMQENKYHNNVKIHEPKPIKILHRLILVRHTYEYFLSAFSPLCLPYFDRGEPSNL